MNKTEYKLLADDCHSYSLSITAGFPLVRCDVAALLLRAHEAISSLEGKSIELSRLNANKDLSVIKLKAELSLYERSQN